MLEEPTSTATTAIPTINFDYHSHHWRCRHAVGQMSEYIDVAAQARGMVEFGVSDHGPAYWSTEDRALPYTQMATSEFPGYVAEALQLKERYAGQIAVRVGVEADYLEEREADLAQLLGEHPFDYVLGSVHYLLGHSVFSPKRWMYERAEDTYAAYYRLVIRAAQSGLFDILSHLTVIEAFGPAVSDSLADELYPPVADAIAASGCVVEVNTSGFRKMGGDDPFPNRRMLRLLAQRGVPLTFGSDCHNPGEVGFGRGRVAALLAGLGIQHAAEHVQVRRGPLLALVPRRPETVSAL